jgi:hypothetical protein
LFPIDWPEPFGLVMIEAMACGTPVLAFRQGSVSEIVDQGVTGAIVDTMEEAVNMLPRVLALDRHAVRRRFEERFSATRMAADYVALYRSMLKWPSIAEAETSAPLPRDGYWEKSRMDMVFLVIERPALWVGAINSHGRTARRFRDTAEIAHAAKLEFSRNDRSQDREAGRKRKPTP